MRWIVALRRMDYVRRFRRHFPDRPRPTDVFYYLHIGKTGGTFVTDLSKDPTMFERAPCPFIRLTHNLKHHHMPQGARFVFGTRDPVQRFVSGFYSRKVLRKRGRLSRGEARAFARFETPNQLAEALDATDQILRGAAQDAMASIEHVNAPHHSWFKDRERLAADIRSGHAFRVRQEALNADLRAALAANGFRISRSMLEDRPRAHSSPVKLDKALSDKAVANLKAFYAKDFEFLQWLDDQGLTGAARDCADV